MLCLPGSPDANSKLRNSSPVISNALCSCVSLCLCLPLEPIPDSHVIYVIALKYLKFLWKATGVLRNNVYVRSKWLFPGPGRVDCRSFLSPGLCFFHLSSSSALTSSGTHPFPQQCLTLSRHHRAVLSPSQIWRGASILSSPIELFSRRETWTLLESAGHSVRGSRIGLPAILLSNIFQRILG